MWGCKDFVQELAQIEKLLSFQPQEGLQKSLVGTLMKKLEHADKLQASEYVGMLEGLQNCGLADNVKAELQNYLLERAASNNESGNKLVKMPQLLENPAAYLTKSELVSLMQGPIGEVPLIIARRLRTIGLTSLKENTKKSCVALNVQAMLWQNHGQPSAKTVYGMAQSFVGVFHDLDVKSAVAPLKNYPRNPNDLGIQWVQKAYAGEQPSCADLPQLQLLRKNCPVRKSSKLLQGGACGQGASSESGYHAPCTTMRACGSMITNISIVHVTYDSPIPEYVSHRCARLKTHQQTVAAERRKERPPVVRLSCVLIG